MQKHPINVTQPNLPPLEELIPYLQKIWDNKFLTNGGPFHQELEDALREYLRVPYISLFSNATIGLITAIKALNINGEVITTPYSFVATAHSLLWNDITPVFVDIDPISLNIDVEKIEAAITPRTTAIMAVHVYGQPCDVDRIDAIAKKNNLKVIYDAAHTFGVECHCGSVLTHGDLSVLSFHATKVFNTFEGGAIICKDPEMNTRINQLKNFGFTSETEVTEVGINGKMNEFSAALGLLQIRYIDDAIKSRKHIDSVYRQELKGVSGIRCHFNTNSLKSNYSYFPIFVEADYPLSRDDLYEKLKKNGINGRRYFFPLITEFPMYKKFAHQNLGIANEISKKVICLPIYPELSLNQLKDIVNLIKN